LTDAVQQVILLNFSSCKYMKQPFYHCKIIKQSLIPKRTITDLHGHPSACQTNHEWHENQILSRKAFPVST